MDTQRELDLSELEQVQGGWEKSISEYDKFKVGGRVSCQIAGVDREGTIVAVIQNHILIDDDCNAFSSGSKDEYYVDVLFDGDANPSRFTNLSYLKVVG